MVVLTEEFEEVAIKRGSNRCVNKKNFSIITLLTFVAGVNLNRLEVIQQRFKSDDRTFVCVKTRVRFSSLVVYKWLFHNPIIKILQSCERLSQ